MIVLTERDIPIDTNKIDPRIVDPKLRPHFWVLDFAANSDGPDYFCVPAPLEAFLDTEAVLKVSGHEVGIPYSWKIMCYGNGNVEAMTIDEIAGKSMTTFCFNPMSGYMPVYLETKLVGMNKSVPWTAPRLTPTQCLLIPVGYRSLPNGVDSSVCILACPRKNRVPEVVDAGLLS